MRTRIDDLVRALRERVKSNLEVVHRNEALIREILNEPLGNSRSARLKEGLDINKKILEENKDSIHLQNSLILFLNKYKEIPEYSDNLVLSEGSVNDSDLSNTERGMDNGSLGSSKIVESNVEKEKGDDGVVVEPTFQSILDMTTRGEILFNPMHPMFGNKRFFQRLLDFHTEREEYERCAELMRISYGK